MPPKFAEAQPPSRAGRVTERQSLSTHQTAEPQELRASGQFSASLLHSRQRHLQQHNLLNPLVQRFDLAILGEAVGAVAGSGAG
jgi:hypothetical protein